MDLMEIRRGLLAHKAERYKKIEFALDGAIHNIDVTLPNSNFSMLIVVPASNENIPNYLFMSSTNSTNSLRYFQLGTYRTYYYLDVGKQRQAYNFSDGYSQYQSHRFAFSVSNGESRRCCDNSTIAVKSSDIDNAGTLLCNQNKKNLATPNLVTAYLYDCVLTDSELQNFTQNGILP